MTMLRSIPALPAHACRQGFYFAGIPFSPVHASFVGISFRWKRLTPFFRYHCGLDQELSPQGGGACS
jgi:hypothetical protein